VGLWAVTNANTYSGGTAVTAGTLYANSTTGSTTGSGTVAVTNGGTLSGGTLSGGNGMIAPSGTNGITVTSGGSVTPGGVQTPVGTYASYTGGPTNVVNGSITLSTANITASSTVLAMAPQFEFGWIDLRFGSRRCRCHEQPQQRQPVARLGQHGKHHEFQHRWHGWAGWHQHGGYDQRSDW